MKKVNVTSRERKSLLGIYKRCIEAVSFEPKRYNKKFSDSEDNFKRRVLLKMSLV